ncbi:MAG: glutathione S-transferase N-terminal domain-containing protein, partial [Pseudomonadota bacterium]|nr:glutathione S-transferase N-terminal domain-containing protein [Pseudomonadota bacterium]
MTELILGNLNYSSWSIRAALVARACGLNIRERIEPLGFDETKAKLIAETGSHTVPVLVTDGLVIRDSLAITEWIAERADAGAVWPTDTGKRALARSVVAEMHSGFPVLRKLCPMDIRSRHATPELTEALAADIARVDRIWTETRESFAENGPFLFGEWCAADAVY